MRLLASTWIALSIISLTLSALAQQTIELEADPSLPRRDPFARPKPPAQTETGQFNHPPGGPSSGPSKTPVKLQGTVSTFEQAVEAERGVVDWYQWYLAARDYLAATGGFNCPLGTHIKFYKNGRVEALSKDAFCMLSAKLKRFALPRETMLDALILPVRPYEAPPASPDEIYRRTGDR